LTQDKIFLGIWCRNST